MKRKPIIHRFRLPYTEQQVFDMLLQACKVEVMHRHRLFQQTSQYMQHIKDVAKWITSDAPDDNTFGLFLCGGAGNGKTTLVYALQNLVNYLRSDEKYSSRNDQFPIPGFLIINAKELVRLAKAYNNHNKDNASDVALYKKLKDVEVLAIDDLGTDARENLHYGDIVTATMDMISYRYQSQLCTIITSNLEPKDIASHYDGRIADRFREMMLIINFGNEKSFRKNE